MPRSDAAEDLYLRRGATDAAVRHDANTRFGSARLADALARALALAPGHVLLDVGCGSGAQLAELAIHLEPGGRAIGLDFSPDAVDAARARGLDARVADAAAPELPPASVDAVNAAYMAYYLDDLDAAVAAWSEVLRPGGRLVVCGPAADTNAALYAFHRRTTGHPPSDADRFALGHVARTVPPAAERAGLRVLAVDPFDNAVTWPDTDAFLTYWRHTSLFLRTVPPEAHDTAVATARARLARTGPPTVRKRTTIVVAERPIPG